MVAAVAYAHNQKIIHCDLKTENMILLRMAGCNWPISVSPKWLSAPSTGQDREPLATWPRAGHGTPEHQKRRILAGTDHVPHVYGHLPTYPFEWPFKGHASLRRKAHPE